MVHGSDSPESAAREAALFFPSCPRPRRAPRMAPAAGPGLSSPQRRAILERLEVAFTVRVPDVERARAGDPEEVARENALRKARAALRPGAAEAVLGCDTIVVLDGTIYGKPPDEPRRARRSRRSADAHTR